MYETRIEPFHCRIRKSNWNLPSTNEMNAQKNSIKNIQRIHANYWWRLHLLDKHQLENVVRKWNGYPFTDSVCYGMIMWIVCMFLVFISLKFETETETRKLVINILFIIIAQHAQKQKIHRKQLHCTKITRKRSHCSWHVRCLRLTTFLSRQSSCFIAKHPTVRISIHWYGISELRLNWII